MHKSVENRINMHVIILINDPLQFLWEKVGQLPVMHKSTVARTVMCRQDGRGRFPVLLDDLSKCRTNSQRTTQLRIFYMICTLNDIYKQYNKLHKHWYTKNQFTSLCRGQKLAWKCIRLIYWSYAEHCRPCARLSGVNWWTKSWGNKKKKKKKKNTNCSYRIFIVCRSPVSSVIWARILLS